MKAESITIAITADDIKFGTHRCDSCPVALALRRATKNQTWLAHWKWMSSGQDDAYREFAAVPAVQDFIVRFDVGEPVTPSTFTFDLVPL